MINFKVSAPGKVILHGEHAVVYGKTAVAASLNLRTTVKFTELLDPDLREPIIKIEFPHVKLSLDVPLFVLHNAFFDVNNFNYPKLKECNLLHSYVQNFLSLIDNLIDSNDEKVIKQQRLSLQAFFYLLVCITYEEHIDIKEDTSFHVHLSTELEISSGLGSSASFAVCLAACFLHWSRLQRGDHDTFSKDELDKISKYALNCEKIMHESPSGIDNSVCTYGSVIKFQNKELVDVLPRVPNLKILLVNTNVARSTKDQVRRAARLKESYPLIVTPVLDSIDALSESAWEAIKEMSSRADDSTEPLDDEPDWYKTLSMFIYMNQGLLKALNVSHPKLDTICALAWQETYAGKLTGAGGGGYAYILLPPNVKNESIEFRTFLLQLEAKGFDVTMTSLGGSGVKIEHLE